MSTKRILGLVWVSLVIFALPAAGQTPDGITPANEGICDSLDSATPGLQGLCVAMCEAQDCEATEDPDTGEITFSPSCNNSSTQLLANYNKLKEPADPPMPCVKVACPCWAAEQVGDIGGQSDSCMEYDNAAGLFGMEPGGGGYEWAYAIDDYTNGLMCLSNINPSTSKAKNINDAQYTVCRQAVLEECTRRSLLP